MPTAEQASGIEFQGKFYKSPSKNVCLLHPCWCHLDVWVWLSPDTPPMSPPALIQAHFIVDSPLFGWPAAVVPTAFGHPADQPLHQGLPKYTEEKKVGQVGEKSSFLAWVCWSTTGSVYRKTLSSGILLKICFCFRQKKSSFIYHVVVWL